jgi:hypothetical protein
LENKIFSDDIFSGENDQPSPSSEKLQLPQQHEFELATATHTTSMSVRIGRAQVKKGRLEKKTTDGSQSWVPGLVWNSSNPCVVLPVFRRPTKKELPMQPPLRSLYIGNMHSRSK